MFVSTLRIAVGRRKSGEIFAQKSLRFRKRGKRKGEPLDHSGYFGWFDFSGYFGQLGR